MSGITSNKLKDKKEQILSVWEKRCIEQVDSASKATSLAIRDSVPSYLNHLIEALSTNLRMDFRSIFRRDRAAAQIGKLHGADRAKNRGYLLTEVIFEYHILREAIFQTLEEDHTLEPIERDIILDSIEQAVNDAAVEFSEFHTDIQQKFVNTLTHDLKTPITAAKMYTQLILRLPDLPEKATHTSEKVIASLNRLENMIHDLLDASRLRAGEKLLLHPRRCDLNALMREIIGEMAVAHGERFVLNSKEAVEGNWDSDGLRRAIENLIGNAVKYGAPETPITISLTRRESTAEVRVHNLGPAIPENEISLLFQDFRRSKSAQEGTQTGWGLGLTLVKGVVDAHKGSVRIESREGSGTSFIMELPYGETSSNLSLSEIA